MRHVHPVISASRPMSRKSNKVVSALVLALMITSVSVPQTMATTNYRGSLSTTISSGMTLCRTSYNPYHRPALTKTLSVESTAVYAPHGTKISRVNQTLTIWYKAKDTTTWQRMQPTVRAGSWNWTPQHVIWTVPFHNVAIYPDWQGQILVHERIEYFDSAGRSVGTPWESWENEYLSSLSAYPSTYQQQSGTCIF